MNGWLERVYFGNTWLDYLLALLGFLIAVVIIRVGQTVLLRRWKAWAKTTATRLDDLILEISEGSLIPLLYFVAFYAAVRSLVLSSGIERALTAVTAALLTFFGVRFVLNLIRWSIFDLYVRRQQHAPELENRFRALMPLISVLIWLIGVVFLLDNLGFEVSAVVAGLGIGGVAVALAGAAVLGDLFAYLAIMLDRPFVLGDFIAVGDFLGSVERVGIKTTRLRSLNGEQIIMANKDLTDSRVRNFKRMEQRRVVFKVGVVYDTPVEKLKELPAFLASVISREPLAKFDRAHFFAFGDFSLVFEVVYMVLSPDYRDYMDVQQRVNLAIKAGFEERGVGFAYPTQTIHLPGFCEMPAGRS